VWAGLFGKKLTLSLEATFSGNPAGGTTFTNAASLQINDKEAASDGETVTIAPTYRVYYNANGGVGAVPTDETEYAEGSNVTVLSVPQPARAGYVFAGWSRLSVGATTSGFTMPAANVVLYAQWTAVNEPPTPEPPTPPTPEPPVAPTTPATPASPAANPDTNILDIDIPLGTVELESAWSLLSLILSLIAVIGTVILAITPLFKRRRNKDDQSADDYSETDDRESNSRKRTMIFRILSIVAGILTPVIWVILETFSSSIVWINRWTPYVAAMFVIYLAMLVVLQFTKRQKKGKYAQEGDVENTVAW
jgi:uncharacterized repeat protein (TIGR02543 family)